MIPVSVRRSPASTALTMPDKDLSVESSEQTCVPVTFDRCDHVAGPFFPGTKIAFDVGDEIKPVISPTSMRVVGSNHVYFAALLEPAVWGAELAVALTGSELRGRIDVVEPTGPFEDDPNVTNKRFPGNITRSSEPAIRCGWSTRSMTGRAMRPKLCCRECLTTSHGSANRGWTS
jgi:hypothetical protein